MPPKRGHDGPPRKQGRGRPPARRQPPPDATGREGQFLALVREAQSIVTAHLQDGSSVTGTVEYYDTDLVKIVPEVGPGLLVRKRDIRYLVEGTD